MTLHKSCEMQLPAWLDDFIDDWNEPLETIEQRMHLAVTLAAENVKHHTGGPFGAIVVEDDSNRLLSVGVNLVTSVELSLAHAEMVARCVSAPFPGRVSAVSSGARARKMQKKRASMRVTSLPTG